MEHISSRKNSILVHMKKLANDASYRRECGEYVCDGEKLLREALSWRAEVLCVLWGGEKTMSLPQGIEEYSCPADVMQSVSPLKCSKGPVFSLRIPRRQDDCERISSAIVLESVQDPGNVGTVIRTANAMNTGAVILVGDCAELFSPKTARATMGAIFRQRVIELDLEQLPGLLKRNGLRLYGAALSADSKDIRETELRGAAVAVGSEGRGLSEKLLSMCDGRLIIPMNADCESMNAAVAASVIMWEMRRND